MSPPLFLLDDIPDTPELFLSGDEGRHAARVQRIRAGETIRVADGAGTVLTCRVRSVVADGLHLTVVDRRHVPPPDPRIVVVQALAKGERSELAVEMLTELGADELLPWAASRSVVQWHGARGDKALERWRRTARAAAKQSRRARVPDIADLHSTADVVARLGGAAGLVLHEDAARPLASAPLPERGHIVVVVGPEGGVAPEELAQLTGAGAAAVRLGTQVLRSSSAGAAALAVLSVRLGRWA